MNRAAIPSKLSHPLLPPFFSALLFELFLFQALSCAYFFERYFLLDKQAAVKRRF
jgi:hypothetical protein